MKGKKRRVWIPIVIVLVVIAAAVYAVNAATSGPQAKLVNTFQVELTDLASSVAVTGVVESAAETNVYTTLTYPVKSVEVEVGDQVAAGDVLCQLDTAALESTIAQNEATLAAGQAKLGHSIQMAQEGRVNDPENQRVSYDEAIEKAEQAVETAENGVDSARHNVDDIRDLLRDLRDGKELVADGTSFDDQIEVQQSNLVTAEIALENAQLGYESALAALENAMDQKERMLPQTERAAQDQLETAQLAAADLESSRIALEKLRSDLGKAAVTAEVSGTVTAVFAKEGAPASGVLFVIEDTGSLRVATKIKEYDIGTVGEGMPVVIKTDGTGDEEFTGTLSKVYPTAAKDAVGGVQDTTNVEFPAEVSVDPGSKLRIGMNARLTITTEEKKGVITVPFEAISSDAEGNTFVFVMETGADGASAARKVPVTPGMETDFYSEVLDSALKEGDLVIASAEGIEDGDLVFTAPAAGSQAQAG